jgi:DNA-binding response OmpR family regulator
MSAIHVLEHAPSGPDTLAGLLTRGGFDAQAFDTAHDYFYQLAKRPPRCLIVDWMFSHIGGIEIVQRTRELLGAHVGIIMVIERACEETSLAALRAGADDCITRPVKSALLAARVEALLRRLGSAPAAQARRLVVGPYALDLGSRTVTVDDIDAGLAPREFDLAWLLFSKPSRLLTREELLALLWGRDARAGAHTITQHVYALRKKLDFSEHGFALQAVYGTGYRLERLTGPARGARGVSKDTVLAVGAQRV